MQIVYESLALRYNGNIRKGRCRMEFVHDIVESQATWAILCILLAAAVIRELWRASMKREDKLMLHLERSNESQEKTAKTLDSVQRTLDTMEGRMDRMEKIIYKEEVR